MEARGVAVVAISKDSAATSKAFAERYGIWFPLIADEDLEISKQWVGVNTEGYAIPGLFVIKAGGEVVLRKIGERKDDRIYATELVARLDDLLATDSSKRVAVKGGFGPIGRAQLRAAFGGGAGRASGDTDAAGSIAFEGLYPLGSSLLIGPAATAVLSGDSLIEVSATAKLRRPVYADLIETYVSVPVGVAIRLEDGDAVDRLGFHTGARIGLQFAVWPAAAPFLELGGTYNRFATDTDAIDAFRFMIRTGIAWMP